ncbi:hypothetical protein CK203_090429 [Vitis vinifera]|uniref:HAT C-terminal dimerisation domain-containing protein n=1 Tax=Vitis vinifera TaxID=29760 RepID=A0A438BVV9_VITVI|nr:hypothetical protein CK203_090429 [Vitis vinifera]
MASEGGSAMPGRDPAWKYVHQLRCPRVPPEVKEEIRLLVHDKQKAKAKKNADIEEIRSQLRGTMGTHHTHLVNEDDDDEDAEEEDVYMYPTDMHPDERDAYRSAVRASKASNWEREQHENIVGSKRKSGESSTGIPSTMRKSQNIFKGGAIKETMGRLISKFFIYESVAPAKAKSHHFKNMIIGAQQAGMGIEPPSPYEIKNNTWKWSTKKWKLMETIDEEVNLYWTPCAAHCIDLIFEDIAQMRKYCGGDIVRPGATRLTNIVSLYEPLYVVLRLVDSEVVPTMPFVYELMQVMKENLIRQGAGDWMFKIIQDRWQKTLKHPLHAAAYFLNPRFQYRRGVGSDPELLQAVHDVFAKLDPTTESLGQFGNELVLFRDAKEDSVIERQLHQAEWWFMYVNQTPTLRKLAIKVLSQTASSSACERNWSTFALIHTKQRNRLAYSRLEQLVFCYYNMRLKLRDMEAENDRVAEKDYLDLLDISTEQEIDSTSAGHSSRPSAAGTSASGYDGSRGGTDDGDHGSRRAGPGIGAIGRPYRGRERMMEPYNEELLSGSFESMSIGTQFSDSSNEANVYPPHVMSYGQPSSSTDEKYGMSHYSPSRQMPYQIPYQMEEGFGVNTWVNFEYPIHVEAVGRTQEIYAWHVRIYNQYYRGSLTWYQYCLQQQAGVPSSINPIEPHRNSFWY